MKVASLFYPSRVAAIKVVSLLIALSMFYGCKKDDNPTPVQPSSACIITSEATSLVGNNATWQYEYDADGNPVKITKYYFNGSPSSTMEIGHTITKLTGSSSSTGNPFIVETKYDADLFQKELPYMLQISLTLDGITQVNYKQFFFFYDSKNRVNKIGEQTNFVGDYEYDINIFYNDQDNVTGLQYVWTTGPNVALDPITVTAYDDKPTPYASINIWKFLMSNFSWDNYDPEPVLTALSRNNPLDYTFGTYKREMSYTYNDQGFPLQRTNKNINPNGEYTFVQTFSYTCK